MVILASKLRQVESRKGFRPARAPERAKLGKSSRQFFFCFYPKEIVTKMDRRLLVASFKVKAEAFGGGAGKALFGAFLDAVFAAPKTGAVIFGCIAA